MKRERQNLAILIAAVTLLPALGAVLVLSGCETSNAAEAKAEPVAEAEQQVVHPVRVAQATIGDVKTVITRVATISAPNTVDVLPLTGGQVVAVEVEEGDYVTASDVVAMLDDEQLRLAEEMAEAKRDKALHDSEIAGRKFEKKIIGSEERLELLHRCEQAERDYQRARLERKKTLIRATISGVVSRRHVSLGDTVFRTTTLFTITDLSLLEAEVLIPQDQIEQVSVGNGVILYIGGDAARAVTGTVARISPVVETESGTVRVTVRVPAAQRRVLPGQFVKAHIITGLKRNVTLVPREAIVIENAMSVIYKVVNGLAHRVPVEVGFIGGNGIQVSGDIAPGDTVIVAGMSGINDMSKIRILPSGAE